MNPLAPGATIGILGTGQLGRMLAIAAAELGFNTLVYGPETEPPAAQVASAHIRADYDDIHELEHFATRCDVVTFEFENIPADPLKAIAAYAPLRPSYRSLEASQDRLVEKRFLSDLGQSVARFAPVTTPDELSYAMDQIGSPAILKTRRFGYDGKGQVRLHPNSAYDPQALLEEIGSDACILEERVDIQAETSVVLARGVNGETRAYDLPVNVHMRGILHTSSVGQFQSPPLSREITKKAIEQTKQVANALDHVGVLTVEFFVTSSGQLLVNELAPRVHNSGHWTMDACLHDQFDNHIRAIAGLPLAATRRHSDAQMLNLIGDAVDDLGPHWHEGNARLHLYGKSESRPGRKMGHVNRLAPLTRSD